MSDIRKAAILLTALPEEEAILQHELELSLKKKGSGGEQPVGRDNVETASSRRGTQFWNGRDDEWGSRWRYRWCADGGWSRRRNAAWWEKAKSESEEERE